MKETELKIHKLTKKYGGFLALNDFSYTFTPGIYGLLGPNGAGKSTLMNIITNNLSASSGEITFNGVATTELGAGFREKLGFMPQQQVLYPYFTLDRFLFFMAALKGIHKKEAEEQIERLLELVNLEEFRTKKLGGFSGGMKQRALIAQALLGNPQIIILDEPTAGLDPKERIRIRNMLAEVAFNKIVILATHVVSDIEFIAKEILLLNKGEIINAGAPYDLCDMLNGSVFEIEAEEGQLPEIQRRFKVGNISRDKASIYVRVLSDKEPTGYVFQEKKPMLEDLYLYYFD